MPLPPAFVQQQPYPSYYHPSGAAPYQQQQYGMVGPPHQHGYLQQQLPHHWSSYGRHQPQQHVQQSHPSMQGHQHHQPGMMHSYEMAYYNSYTWTADSSHQHQPTSDSVAVASQETGDGCPREHPERGAEQSKRKTEEDDADDASIFNNSTYSTFVEGAVDDQHLPSHLLSSSDDDSTRKGKDSPKAFPIDGVDDDDSIDEALSGAMRGTPGLRSFSFRPFFRRSITNYRKSPPTLQVETAEAPLLSGEADMETQTPVSDAESAPVPREDRDGLLRVEALSPSSRATLETVLDDGGAGHRKTNSLGKSRFSFLQFGTSASRRSTIICDDPTVVSASTAGDSGQDFQDSNEQSDLGITGPEQDLSYPVQEEGEDFSLTGNTSYEIDSTDEVLSLAEEPIIIDGVPPYEKSTSNVVQKRSGWLLQDRVWSSIGTPSVFRRSAVVTKPTARHNQDEQRLDTTDVVEVAISGDGKVESAEGSEMIELFRRLEVASGTTEV